MEGHAEKIGLAVAAVLIKLLAQRHHAHRIVAQTVVEPQRVLVAGDHLQHHRLDTRFLFSLLLGQGDGAGGDPLPAALLVHKDVRQLHHNRAGAVEVDKAHILPILQNHIQPVIFCGPAAQVVQHGAFFPRLDLLRFIFSADQAAVEPPERLDAAQGGGKILLGV